MRPIDADAVIDELRKFKPEIIPYEKARIYVEKTVKTMYDRIVELPTVQPEPHEGEWINTNPEYKNGFYNNSYYCSECHDYYTTSPYEMKFCPNCGAKMKGAQNG